MTTGPLYTYKLLNSQNQQDNNNNLNWAIIT